MSDEPKVHSIEVKFLKPNIEQRRLHSQSGIESLI
jgi:hypothetical protein